MFLRLLTLTSLLFPLSLSLAAIAGETKKAKTTVVKVTVLEWTPSGKYGPLEGAALLVSRGKKEVLGNQRTKDDALITLTDDKGQATIEFASGTPVTLVSQRGKEKVPEVLSLASVGEDVHEISIALIEVKDYEAFLMKNPGAVPAHTKFAQAYSNIPSAAAKDPKGKQFQKDLIEGYKKTRPNSSVLVPAYFLDKSTAWKTLTDSAAKFPGAPITAIVKPTGAGRVAALQKAGVRVLGFVDAGNGARGKEAADEVKRWYQTQPMIEGIFVDRQPAGEKHVAFNADLAKQVRAEAEAKKRPAPVIVGNCAADFAPALLDDSINHATCCFQGNKVAVPEDVRVPEWLEMAYPSRAAVLVSNLRKQDDMERIVRLLLARQLGYCYFTDRAVNPFADLPTPAYWGRLLELVELANVRELGQDEASARRNRDPNLVLEFALPPGTKVVIPANQVRDIVVDITFQGKNTVRFTSGDRELIFALQEDKGAKGKKPPPKLVLVKRDNPQAFQFGSDADVSSKFGDDEAAEGMAHRFEYEGKPILVDLKPAS